MPEFTYTVTVIAETREQADQVIAERVNHDEDYGFDYQIGYRDGGEPTLDPYSPQALAARDGHHLVDLINAARTALAGRDDAALLDGLAGDLADLGITGVAKVTFGTSEWEDGYYYSAGTMTLLDAQDHEVEAPASARNQLESNVSEALTEVSSSRGPVGRTSTLVVDLAGRTVTDDSLYG